MGLFRQEYWSGSPVPSPDAHLWLNGAQRMLSKALKKLFKVFKCPSNLSAYTVKSQPLSTDDFLVLLNLSSDLPL